MVLNSTANYYPLFLEWPQFKNSKKNIDKVADDVTQQIQFAIKVCKNRLGGNNGNGKKEVELQTRIK